MEQRMVTLVQNLTHMNGVMKPIVALTMKNFQTKQLATEKDSKEVWTDVHKYLKCIEKITSLQLSTDASFQSLVKEEDQSQSIIVQYHEAQEMLNSYLAILQFAVTEYKHCLRARFQVSEAQLQSIPDYDMTALLGSFLQGVQQQADKKGVSRDVLHNHLASVVMQAKTQAAASSGTTTAGTAVGSTTTPAAATISTAANVDAKTEKGDIVDASTSKDGGVVEKAQPAGTHSTFSIKQMLANANSHS
jgi:hypothetical protein